MSRWRDFWEQYRRNRGALVGLAIVALVIAMAATAPIFFPGDPGEMIAQPFLWPLEDREFPLGSDALVLPMKLSSSMAASAVCASVLPTTPNL